MILSNSGNAHAYNLSFSISEEFEVKRIKPTQVDAGKTVTAEIGLMPKNAGSIPFEVTLHYSDGKNREYSETHEFWIDVVDPTIGISAFNRTATHGIPSKPDNGTSGSIHPAIYESADSVIAHEIFITYSHKDKTVADAVTFALENHSIRCWIAPRDVFPGEDFPDAIIKAINTTKIMVLIFSSSSNVSPHVIRELAKAVSSAVIIIPFRIEDTPLSKSMEYPHRNPPLA